LPTVDENREAWARHPWRDGGDEWSEPWGCSRSLWDGTILPRIAAFLPCRHILEIAPGRGRCTQFLLERCERLSAVDLVPECVRACEERFARFPHASFHLNDGRSLDTVDDASVDFAFSWDSLVHADEAVMHSYVRELATKLRPGAAAFLHHSTLGDHRDPATGAPPAANPCWRDPIMTAEKLRDDCATAGLICVSQEIVPWGGEALTDCFSVLRRPAGDAEHVSGQSTAGPREVRLFHNSEFPAEVARRRQIHDLYGCPDENCRAHSAGRMAPSSD
jgi:hypothetical protein